LLLLASVVALVMVVVVVAFLSFRSNYFVVIISEFLLWRAKYYNWRFCGHFRQEESLARLGLLLQEVW